MSKTNHRIKVEYIKPSTIESEVLGDQKLREPPPNYVEEITNYNPYAEDVRVQIDGETFAPIMSTQVEETAFSTSKSHTKLRKPNQNGGSIFLNPNYSEICSEVITGPQPLREDQIDTVAVCDRGIDEKKSKIPVNQTREELKTKEPIDIRDTKDIPNPKPRRSSIPIKTSKPAAKNDIHPDKIEDDIKSTAKVDVIEDLVSKYEDKVIVSDEIDVIEKEFDKIYEETADDQQSDVLNEKVEELIDNINDPELVETTFDEIVQEYDDNKVQPFIFGKIRTKIPMLKQKSLYDLGLPRNLDRRLSLNDNPHKANNDKVVKEQTINVPNTVDREEISTPKCDDSKIQATLDEEVINTMDDEPNPNDANIPENESVKIATPIVEEITLNPPTKERLQESYVSMVKDSSNEMPDSSLLVRNILNQILKNNIPEKEHIEEDKHLKDVSIIEDQQNNNSKNENDSKTEKIETVEIVDESTKKVDGKEPDPKMRSVRSKIAIFSRLKPRDAAKSITNQHNLPSSDRESKEPKLNRNEREKEIMPVDSDTGVKCDTETNPMHLEINKQNIDEANSSKIPNVDKELTVNKIPGKVRQLQSLESNKYKHQVGEQEDGVYPKSDEKQVAVEKEPVIKPIEMIATPEIQEKRVEEIPIRKSVKSKIAIFNRFKDQPSSVANKKPHLPPTSKLGPKINSIAKDTELSFESGNAPVDKQLDEEMPSKIQTERDEKHTEKVPLNIDSKTSTPDVNIKNTSETANRNSNEPETPTQDKHEDKRDSKTELNDAVHEVERDKNIQEVPIPKGTVHKIINRLHSQESNDVKKEIDIDELPKKRPVSSKIALFERQLTPPPSPKIINHKPKIADHVAKQDAIALSGNETELSKKDDVEKSDTLDKLADTTVKTIQNDEDTDDNVFRNDVTNNVAPATERTRNPNDMSTKERHILERKRSTQENKRRRKSGADEVEPKVKGRVSEMVFKIKSMENLNIIDSKTEKLPINIREMPRKKSVSEKIALFENKIVPVKLEKSEPKRGWTTVKPENVTRKELTKEEIGEKIKELADAKSKYGSIVVRNITLNDGNEMPVLALGTALLHPDLIKPVIAAAIDLGYRAIDTAFIYGNERLVGEAIQQKIQDGTVTRQDLFIISKLWSTFHRSDLAEAACRASLHEMQLEYFDLYLIHNPMSFKEGGDVIPKIANVIQYSTHDYMDAWRGLEDLVDKGLVTSIGVSNFNAAQVTRVIEKGRIKPAINQVECHPYLSQARLDQACDVNEIKLCCFGILGSKGTPAELKTGLTPVIDDPMVNVMAAGLGITPGQLLIRYQIAKGHMVVVKSSSASHLWENLQALKGGLTAAEIGGLNALNKNKRTYAFKGMGETHKNYPFNSSY